MEVTLVKVTLRQRSLRGGHLQDLRNVDMGHYDMFNYHPPLHHEHRGHAINNNYAGVALDVPVQAQAAPPVPVCTDLTHFHTQT